MQHLVSSQGTKRKRPGADSAPAALHGPAVPSRTDKNDATRKVGHAHPAKSQSDPRLQHMNGDDHASSDSKSNTRSSKGTHAPAQNPNANRQQYVSLAEKRKKLLDTRKKLPIWPHAEKVRQSLRGDKDVMLLVGETGSGKSTQVPQFLLDEKWCAGCIAITQPRRVAAISLARRVADEMGTPLGSSSPSSKVGYSVRFDTSVGPSTRVKFLTEGMLLQELLRDPHLRQYSAVIVDEVHERSVNVDLILGFLRNIVRGDKSGRKGQALKVAVMSATADVQKLQSFFEDKITLDDVENASEASWGGVSDDEGAPNEINGSSNGTISHPKSSDSTVSLCYVEGRQFPVQITYLPEPTLDFVEAALKAIFQLHLKEPLPGDILVFLTGQDTVEGLERLINDYAESLDPKLPKILALPLFAALPQAAQQRVFLPPPPRTRKIILSTNIAETSVTVPGVRFVIDSGKHKIKQFRNKLGLDSLLVKPISRSSAIQRTGRAGREAPGKCMRLYTEADFNALEKVGKPEILRCDLAQAVVTMKARGVEDVVGFPWLDAPPREALEKALLQLFQLGALDDSGSITETGKLIAKLPLTPSLGRVLVEAAKEERGCLREVIDVVAALSVENIWLNVGGEEEKREAAEVARAELVRREGDHLTLRAVVRGYASEGTDRKKWAQKYFVSHRAMQNVMDIRKQLTALLKGLKLLSPSSFDEDDSAPSEAINQSILFCLLRGFPSNTARLMPDGSYKTLLSNQTVTVHPSSVLFGKKRAEAIVFTEYVFTTKSYARGVSSVRLGWVDEVLGDLGE